MVQLRTKGCKTLEGRGGEERPRQFRFFIKVKTIWYEK